MPSYPTLVGTCSTFISFSIAISNLGSLEICPPTPSYVVTFYFINNQHHGYGSIAQNPCHRSPFSRSHIVGITVGHKNYRVSLSSDLHLSWLWVIHKPMLHQSPFSRLHTVSITVRHKHYRVSLSLDLCSSWLWVNHTKSLSSMALHIQ